ncbi:MAG: DNA alkylation repair protein, partial [Coprococcus sp.]
TTDIDKLKKLITEKSWWETVDTIDAFVGDLVLQDNSLVETMLEGMGILCSSSINERNERI